MEYVFDVLHQPNDEGQVEKDIIGNVTKSFTELFADEDDVLYPLVMDYGLEFSERSEPTVEMVEGATGKLFVSKWW